MGAGVREFRGVVVVLCLGLASFGWAGGRAVAQSHQGDQPTPGDRAVAYLPAADALGPGWKRFEPTAVANLSADTFQEGALVTYGGPEGARVMLFALLVDEGRVRRAWEEAGSLYNNVLYNLSYDYQRQDELRNVPPPPGCAEAKRVDGRTYFEGFEIGVTLCAVDPDLILLVAASGRVNDESGIAASDNVIDAALEAGGISTVPDDGGEEAVATIVLEGYDIGWRTADQPGPQVELTVAPGATIELLNIGAAQHNFNAQDLGIDQDIPVGYSGEVTIPADAEPGTYEFVCDIPGHAPAGMVGTIVIR